MTSIATQPRCRGGAFPLRPQSTSRRIWQSHPTMDLHEGETVLFEGRPSWRAILGFYIVGALIAAAIAAIVGLITGTGAGAGVFVAIVALVVLVGWIRRIGTRYAITNERLWIQHGLLSRHTQETRLA